MGPNLSPQLSNRLDAANRTIHILWFALMGSVIMYGAVTFILASAGDVEPTPLGLPPFLFPIVAVANATTAFVLYRQLTGPERIRAVLQEQHSGPEQDAVLSDAERRLNRVPPLVFTGSILRWALFESVAVLGLVLGITDRSVESFLPYGIVALGLMASTPPKLRQLTLGATPMLPGQA